MSQAMRVGDDIEGQVNHHAGHIIGWTGGDDPEPIYCSGHSIHGVQTTGSSIVFIDELPAVRIDDAGTTDCACDGKGYINETGSSKVFIDGKPAVRIGDRVNIHGQGTGTVRTGSQKVWIG